MGLDAAFPALFLALVPNLDRPHAKQAAILGAAIALALTPIAPPGVPIVAADSPARSGGGARERRVVDRGPGRHRDDRDQGAGPFCWAAGRSPSGSAA